MRLPALSTLAFVLLLSYPGGARSETSAPRFPDHGPPFTVAGDGDVYFAKLIEGILKKSGFGDAVSDKHRALVVVFTRSTLVSSPEGDRRFLSIHFVDSDRRDLGFWESDLRRGLVDKKGPNRHKRAVDELVKYDLVWITSLARLIAFQLGSSAI